MRFGTKCVLLSFALSGCGSSAPKFYTLQRVTGPVEATGPTTIEVGRPGLAGYLDRSEIVLKDDSYQVSTNGQQLWAEPLGDMIGRVLTQNLSQRLKNSAVYDQGGAITSAPDARVEVDIASLSEDKAGTVSLVAQVAIEQGATHRALAARHVNLQATTDASDPAAMVATMSDLLGQLSDRIASDVRTSTALAATTTPAPVPVAAIATPTTAAQPEVIATNLPQAQSVAVAANTLGTQAMPAVAPAPVTQVAAQTLALGCESGGRAVPCLRAP